MEEKVLKGGLVPISNFGVKAGSQWAPQLSVRSKIPKG